MTMTVQEYRANARQGLSWAESARDPEYRDAFFDLAATWVSAAARIEHAARIEKSTVREPPLRRAAAGDSRPLDKSRQGP
jgi:hypothetical protein